MITISKELRQAIQESKDNLVRPTDPSPLRRIPEEAYSPAKFGKSTHTLDDLLAQVTEDNLPDEDIVEPSAENET